MKKYLLALALMVSCSPAYAQQPQCFNRQVLTTALEGIGERVTNQALAAQGLLTETWVAPSGTWTITVTTPEGMSCIVLHGHSWTSVTPKAQGVPG
jgi:hypothetical protein